MENIDFDLDAPLPERPSTLYPWREIYPHLSRKPIRLSYSTWTLAESCLRKLHLTKDKDLGDWDLPRETRENNVHLDFGTAIGIGVSEAIITGNLEKAIWEALSNYNYAFETPAKNAVSIVTCLQTFMDQWEPDKWEVAVYQGRPASELSFKITLNPETEDYYCGYVDVVLIHKESRLAVVVEVKTTGIKTNDVNPLYRNTAQGLGYSVILDSIAGGAASWTVLYIVFQFKSNNIIPTFHLLPYNKTLRHRLEWLLDLQLIYEKILKQQEMDYWPKKASGCMSFGTPCPLFGVCDLDTMKAEKSALITKEANWDFTFTLEELIARSQ